MNDAGTTPQPPAQPLPDEALTPEERVIKENLTRSRDGTTISDLWAFGFDSPIRAQEALLAAMRLVGRSQLKLEDAAVVTKVSGKVRITQTRDMNPSQGVVGGAWLGVLAGLFLGPGGPLVGAALGAAAGGLFAKLRDIGMDDDEMKRIGDELADGEAALFLLVEDCHQMRALHEVSRFPARILAVTADPDLVTAVEQRLAVDPWGVV